MNWLGSVVQFQSLLLTMWRRAVQLDTNLSALLKFSIAVRNYWTIGGKNLKRQTAVPCIFQNRFVSFVKKRSGTVKTKENGTLYSLLHSLQVQNLCFVWKTNCSQQFSQREKLASFFNIYSVPTWLLASIKVPQHLKIKKLVSDLSYVLNIEPLGVQR